MEKFVVIPDVTCDISQEIREKFNVRDYVQGYVNIDGEDMKSTLDWSNISREEFYKKLENKKIKITSAMASPEEYYLALRKYAEEGYDIISMTLSSKISGTYSVSVKAAERVKEDFPERRIYCFDSLRMSGSFGLLAAYASRMCAEGKSFDEVVEWLEENKHRVHQMGPIDDLTFIARRGKISSGKAFMGNLMGIKPMGDSNTDGYVSVLAKAKGIKKALLATAEYVAKLSEDIENNYVIISHSNRENLALELRDMIIERSHPKEVLVTDVFAGCGTNIGPGMISAYFIGAPVSEGCEAEKTALTEILETL